MFRDGIRLLLARTVPERFVTLAISAALIVTISEPLPAAARSAEFTRPLASGTATDFSAARRRGQVRRHHIRRYGPGPGIAMMGMMIGAIGAIANAERRRTYYDDVPVLYAPQPYYGPQPYHDGYLPGYYGYEPQPTYPVAPAYAAPVYAPAHRVGPAFVPYVHAGAPVVHAAPQFNVARAIPRFLPQGTPIIVSQSLPKTRKVGPRVNTSSASLN